MIGSELVVSEANLYRQVLHRIRETGQFVDDISTRYFQGFHQYLPVISRARFHGNLVTLGAVPSAGFSTLLLSICLASSSTKLGWQAEHKVTYGATARWRHDPHSRDAFRDNLTMEFSRKFRPSFGLKFFFYYFLIS
jgi:hypothetical protein